MKQGTEKSKTDAKAPNGLDLATTRKLRIRPIHLVEIGFGLLLIAFILRVAVWEHFYLARMEGQPRDTETQAYYDGAEEVDETEPILAECTAQNDQPRLISIPSIGINVCVIPVQLKKDGAIDTPSNIHTVGWYTGEGSVAPGKKGVSVMNAHGGALGDGIFRNLPNVKVGDKIIIEMGDKTTKYTYEVADMATKNLGDGAAENYMVEAFTSPKPNSAALTLITCTGDWIWNAQTYTHRLFVRAVLNSENSEN